MSTASSKNSATLTNTGNRKGPSCSKFLCGIHNDTEEAQISFFYVKKISWIEWRSIQT